MDQIQVLVAVEHRAHRESLAEMLRALRPAVSIVEIDPAMLDQAVVEQRPDIVIASAVSEIVETRVFGWVILYPDGQDHALLSLDGQRRQQPAVRVDNVLGFIDETAARLRV